MNVWEGKMQYSIYKPMQHMHCAFCSSVFPSFPHTEPQGTESKTSFATQRATALGFVMWVDRLDNMINEYVSQIQPIIIFRSSSNQLEMPIMNHRFPAWFDSKCLFIDIGHTAYQQIHSSRI